MGTIFDRVSAMLANERDALVQRDGEFLAPGLVLVSGESARAPLRPLAWLVGREDLIEHDWEGALSGLEVVS
jgi:hypothetical protein